VPSTGKLSAFAAEKARTLMASRLPCIGCHRFEGTGGRVGPDLTDVSKRRTPAYIAAIVDDPQGVVPGTAMPRSIMTPDLRALVLAALIGTTPGNVPPRRLASTSSPTGPTLDGAILYARYCAACHGRDGAGDGPNATFLPVRPAAHRDARTMSARTNDRLFDAVAAGGYPLGKNAAMPGFGGILTRGEIWSLVRYLRTLCRCAPPAWSIDGERTMRSPGRR
jgi:mono/diheme cytochrome c family protein